MPNTSYATQPRQNIPGLLVDRSGMSAVSRFNGGKVAKVSTFTFVAANSTAYTYLIEGRTITFTSDSGATQAEIATGLQEAHELDTIANGVAIATVSGNNLILTGREPGRDFALSETDANITIAATTAASNGTNLNFGTFAMQSATADQAEAPTGTNPVAQVMTLTPLAVSSAEYNVNVLLEDGRTITANFTADGSATVSEVVAGLLADFNTNAPANTILASGTTTLILTAEVLGLGFSVGWSSDSAAVSVSVVETTANTNGSFDRDLIGVLERDNSVGLVTQASGGESTGGTSYSANHAMSIVRKGRIWASVDDTVSDGDSVWVRITASATETVGIARNDSDSGDAIQVPGAFFRSAGVSGGQAIVELNLPA